MRAPVFLATILVIASTVAARAVDLADLTMRYVNNEVITMGDIQLRNSMRKKEFTRRGQILPRTPAELVRFSQQSLEDLTDDVLLTQRAREMGIQADHDEIVFEVLQNAKRSGIGLSLRDQAEQRRHLERQRTIERIIGWYDSLMPQPRPQELMAAYNSGQVSHDLPSQSRLLQIILRPAPPEDRTALRTAKAALLRAAQDGTDPALKVIVDARLADFLKADAVAQEAVLDALVTELTGLADRGDLPAADAALVATATSLTKRQTQLLDRQQVKARLETVRLQLTGLTGPGLIKTFHGLASAVSQGPAAAQGGEIGWIEPGLYTKEFDRVAFALVKDELSSVFWVGDVACLVLCADRKAARSRSFDEVSREIETGLRLQRRQESKERAVLILRGKASIRDLGDLNSLAE